jgi:hypothetical protein
MNFRVLLTAIDFWLAEGLPASQGLCSIELVTKIVIMLIVISRRSRSFLRSKNNKSASKKSACIK